MRKSCQLAKATLDYITPFVKEGVSTLYLNDLIENFIINNGGISACFNYYSYPKATCISLNDVIAHGIPSEKEVLKSGDILNIDVTVKLDGYFGDTSRMYFCPPVAEEAYKLIEVTKECMYLGINQVKHGHPINLIGKVIEEHANKNGYTSVSDFVGHGIGENFHQFPPVRHFKNDDTTLMSAGTCFTIEPMLCQFGKELIVLNDGWTAKTVDGGLSAQWEHTIFCTKDGYEILTI